MNHWIVCFRCDDGPGIVHAITGAILSVGGNNTEVQQFTSTDTGRFFLRAEVDAEVDRAGFEAALAPIGAQLRATWRLFEAEKKARTLILASRAGHCLNDLLFHARASDLPIEVPLVMANHPDLADLARFHGVDFEYHPVTSGQDRQAFEARICQVVAEQRIALVVLARYMQVLSPEVCTMLSGKAINIHHSFLPGFKGANPYRQAHARGVKLIGATAHFVTPELDEGPIIEQNVHRVDHAKSVPQLVQLGQGLESATLTEAVRLFAEKRIFLDDQRTVVFR